jgi:hypothetical protein
MRVGGFGLAICPSTLPGCKSNRWCSSSVVFLWVMAKPVKFPCLRHCLVLLEWGFSSYNSGISNAWKHHAY